MAKVSKLSDNAPLAKIIAAEVDAWNQLFSIIFLLIIEASRPDDRKVDLAVERASERAKFKARTRSRLVTSQSIHFNCAHCCTVSVCFSLRCCLSEKSGRDWREHSSVGLPKSIAIDFVLETLENTDGQLLDACYTTSFPMKPLHTFSSVLFKERRKHSMNHSVVRKQALHSPWKGNSQTRINQWRFNPKFSRLPLNCRSG